MKDGTALPQLVFYFLSKGNVKKWEFNLLIYYIKFESSALDQTEQHNLLVTTYCIVLSHTYDYSLNLS